MKRLCVLTVLTTLVSSATAADNTLAKAPKRPNVLIVTTDQQRVDAASVVGNPWLKTPNLDRLVSHGVYFTKSYCSYPLCSPCRASLHTGRFPHEIGVDHNNMSIAPGIPISGELFRAAGYETAYAGKWHLPAAYPSEGIPGFSVLNRIKRQGKLARDVDEATLQAAIDFLKQNREKPFYLVVSFINPHDICLPAGEDSPLLDQIWSLYGPPADAQLPPLPASFRLPETEPQWLLGRRPKHPHWDENHWRRYIYAYYRMVEDVDRQIGRLLETVREIGQEENTLVVFTSDHGEGLGCHRWTGKMMFFDAEAAVPLIISWKGVTPAGRIDREHLVSTVDVLPTICDYAGIEPPPEVRGQSLRSIIEDPAAPWRQYVVSEIAHTPAIGRSFMVRTPRYKYIRLAAAPGKIVELLFDMEKDPEEIYNLAADPKLTNVLEEHRRLLSEWRTLTGETTAAVQPAPKTARPRRAQQAN
ncbi:MAG: sulfatase-like hydrolase/transferase [Thermoguttaceae bacterium]|nr:sulfatase-like hydrolase/transferase [Thermoguttaceae bacterium]MDW8079250.1 sulfatase-like hydrolase/transferase [Thermoguttaceae bacterium]